MNARQVIALPALCMLASLAFGAEAAGDPEERERNAWPGLVRQADPLVKGEYWSAAGPLLFKKPDAEGGTVRGFRPFWVETRNAQGDFRSAFFLYPLFSYSVDENTYRWSLFELVRRWDRRAGAEVPKTIFDQRGEFEIFPLWFSRQSGDPEMSYRGLFPIWGTVKNKLTFERLTWRLFPLYVENEKRGAVTTSTPWPFIRVTRGAAHGWGVWPLFNYVERPGVSRAEYYLWPFGYNVTRLPHPDDPPGTAIRRDVGALPFWARSTGPGYINQDYAWPFFGYTDRTLPTRYHETRYFWPFLVQGRGDDRYVNRYAPFYTHSISKGYDKTWYAWPLVRHAKWTDEGVARDRTQFLYFLYWHETQRAAGRDNSPAARLTHVWPFVSTWDNGAGRRQWQAFSPFDVFFPGNEKVRHAWTPLVAIARHEQRAPGDKRTSLLWNLVTWEQRAAEERKEFHVGPLFSVTEQGDRKRIAIGNGLMGFRRNAAGRRWQPFWLDFASKPATTSSGSR
jgi:hypothetical protein